MRFNMTMIHGCKELIANRAGSAFKDDEGECGPGYRETCRFPITQQAANQAAVP